MARKKQPVTIWGIEFDALIDEQKTLTSTIPAYPVEDGFPVSDTIINEPVSIAMTLFISNTPVTWLYRHGTAKDRVTRICSEIEEKWQEKKLTKIVTSDAIYKDMGITSISIKKSKEIGYAREVTVTAQKVRITKKKTVKIPSYVLKSGETKANAGKATSSTISGKSGSSGTEGSSSSSTKGSASASGKSTGNSGSGSSAKKSQSILYGVASGMKFI